MRLARSKTVSVRLARRAQIVLGAADGLDNETIAAQVGVGRVQVGRWRTRYAAGGLAAIERDLPRGGRPVTVDAAQIVLRQHAIVFLLLGADAIARIVGVAGNEAHNPVTARGCRPRSPCSTA